MEQDQDWAARLTRQIGEQVASFRARATDGRGRKLTAQALADRCKDLGLPIGRPAIAKLESGFRQTITIAEVQVLAQALGVAPVDLLFPVGRAESVEVLPGQQVDPWSAYEWFVGARRTPAHKHAPPPDAEGPLALWAEHRRYEELVSQQAAQGSNLVDKAVEAETHGDADTADNLNRILAFQTSHYETTLMALRRLRGAMRDAGLTPPPVSAWIAVGLGEEPGGSEQTSEGQRREGAR